MKLVEVPPIKLDHLLNLTDDTGILQHAKYSIPKRSEGYTTDDNARSLIVCVKYNILHNDCKIDKLVDIYLSFLLHMQRTDGKFHNFMSYKRCFLDEVGSEDCMGRVLWACGIAINSNLSKEKRMLSKEIFDKCFRWVNEFKSLRAKAFAIIGLQQYYKSYTNDYNLEKNIKMFTDQLCKYYIHSSSKEWKWFESYLTYTNPRLPQALFAAFASTNDPSYLSIGEESLDFLIKTQIVNQIFHPYGNKGWFLKDDQKALYDQQPLEASCMVETATNAYLTTRKKRYLQTVKIAYDWFLGKNSKNMMVYNATTGGCYDGLTSKGLNINQGAESTISHLLARLEIENILNSSDNNNLT